MNLDQIKQQIQGSAILGALLSDGSIQIVYKQPTADDALLFRTWTIEVLIVDEDYTDQARQALDGLGWELVQLGDRITCSKDVPITAAEREQIAATAAAEQQARAEAKAAAREQATRSTLEGLQEQLDELKGDVEVMGLITPKSGARGPQGPAGQPGRDGRDGLVGDVNLNDLADVNAPDPAKGLVLTWTGTAWEPRATQTIASISGGGGGGGGNGGGSGGGGDGGGGGGGEGLRHWTETSQGHLLPNDSGQNLGSLSQPVGELYITGSTVFLDGLPLSLNANSRLAFDGNQLGYGDGEVEEAPLDGGYYVRHMGAWVETEPPRNFDPNAPIDGGDMTNGVALNGPDAYDGGDFEAGQYTGTGDSVVSGGDFSGNTLMKMKLELDEKDRRIEALQQQMDDVLARLSALET